MQLGEEIREEEHFLKNIFNRFRKRDFSGTTGEAMKNSSYQLSQNLVFKFGSLFFTIILARLLLPEMMGLYTLAISTIILFASFSDLGISSAVMTYGARLIGKKEFSKTKGYMKQLFKWKLWLLSITSLILICASYFLAEFYYQKPIFYAILVGAIYIPVYGMITFMQNMFKANENFKTPLIKEIIFQLARFILVPIFIILFLKFGANQEIVVMFTLVAVTLSYSLGLLFLIVKSRKNLEFFKHPLQKPNREEILDLKKFIYPLSATALAGMFFAYIDTFMLGHYVQSEFIAYYGAAFSLVGGAVGIIGFMSISLMPIFAKKTGIALEKIFKKGRNLVFLISFAAAIFTYFAAYYIIRIAYGVEYLAAVPILKWFALLVFLMPILSLYVAYFTTQKKTKELAWLIVGSAVLNIVLNYFGINYGLNVGGEMGALYGAAGATITSRILYLIGLVVFRRK